MSLQKIITTLRPLREFVGEIDGHELVFPPDVPPQAAELVSNASQTLGLGRDTKTVQVRSHVPLWSVSLSRGSSLSLMVQLCKSVLRRMHWWGLVSLRRSWV